ncbi:hypothetical protein [Halobaculum sp. P14]|uniref:hypothetical protein n=1 Tax=Halobaculum sp. P14 TaxID=3421638 RepID=UPI003EBF7185
MDATSWLGYVRTFDAAAERALDWTEMPEPAALWSEVLSLDAALREFGETVDAALPLPTPTETPESGVDAAVQDVLAALRSAESPPAESVETAADADRLSRHGDGVTVPLPTRGAGVANWYVVVPFVGEAFDGAAARYDRVAGRLGLVDCDSSAAAYRDVADALRDSARVLRFTAARALWLNPPDDLVDAEYEQIRAFATRTIDAYNPHA